MKMRAIFSKEELMSVWNLLHFLEQIKATDIAFRIESTEVDSNHNCYLEYIGDSYG